VVLPFAKTIFYEKIVPQNHQKLAEYEQQENRVNVKWNFKLEYNIDCSAIVEIRALTEIHAQIVKEEQTVRNLELTVVFHRGLLYLSACNLAPAHANLRNWLSNKLVSAAATGTHTHI